MKNLLLTVCIIIGNVFLYFSSWKIGIPATILSICFCIMFYDVTTLLADYTVTNTVLHEKNITQLNIVIDWINRFTDMLKKEVKDGKGISEDSINPEDFRN